MKVCYPKKQYILLNSQQEIGYYEFYLPPLQAKVAHKQPMHMVQMSLQLFDAPEPASAPWLTNRGSLILCIVTHTTRKPTHCSYHLVVICIIKICLCILMVPEIPCLSLIYPGREHREISDHSCIITQGLLHGKIINTLHSCNKI